MFHKTLLLSEELLLIENTLIDCYFERKVFTEDLSDEILKNLYCRSNPLGVCHIDCMRRE